MKWPPFELLQRAVVTYKLIQQLPNAPEAMRLRIDREEAPFLEERRAGASEASNAPDALRLKTWREEAPLSEERRPRAGASEASARNLRAPSFADFGFETVREVPPEQAPPAEEAAAARASEDSLAA